MAKTYRPYLPEQEVLLPPSPRAWLPADHLAYFVRELVDELGLSAITARYEDEERGSLTRLTLTGALQLCPAHGAPFADDHSC